MMISKTQFKRGAVFKTKVPLPLKHVFILTKSNKFKNFVINVNKVLIFQNIV